MGTNVGSQGEESTLAWFPVMLACSHRLPLAAFLYHVGTEHVVAGCCWLPGQSTTPPQTQLHVQNWIFFSLIHVSCLSSQFLLHQQT